MAKRIISAHRLNVKQYLGKVIHYRHLIFLFAIKDLKVKYSQTVLGLLWTILQPLTGLLIFTFFFDKVLDFYQEEIPYPLFAFSGMISWYYFTYIVMQGGTALTESQHILKKIYFPRIILPLSKVLVGFVDFAISFVLLFIMMMMTSRYPGFDVVYFPLFILLNVITGLSLAIWLSALTVRYRDFHHIIPYLVNFGIWLTPVFYPFTIIPQQYQFFTYFNPMAGVIAGFRFSLLGDTPPDPNFLISFIPVTLLLFLGLIYFRRIEGRIADTI